MAGHTKTPWTAQVFAVVDGDGGYVVHAGGMGRNADEQIANAEFICRACNAHEALLALAREVAGDFDDMDWEDAHIILARLARAAIALAESPVQERK